MAAERALLPLTPAPTATPNTTEGDAQGQWHTPHVTSLSARLLWSGDRRMEAETYLTSGYGLRLAIEAQAQGWARFHEFANVWQPSRLKGIQVSSTEGTPFLAATQAFDLRPMPRKWLALERIAATQNLFVKEGTFIVTRSGTVGRATLAYKAHKDTLLSDDLLRVDAKETKQHGWIYAYLRAPQVRAMMSSAQYGHIIKHLEVGHLNALPIPRVSDDIAKVFAAQVDAILQARNEAHRLSLEAEARFEKALGIKSPEELKFSNWGESGYSLKASALFGERRRLEGTFHNPGAAAIRLLLSERSKSISTLGAAGYDVWLPTRFRRIPADDGVWLVSSSALFEINPDFEKRIADGNFGDRNRGRVEPGWLLLSRSGQTYGVLGSVTLATEALANHIISDHVIRIAPNENANARAGYIQTALAHPILGRPLVKGLAYGSSIPAIEPTDMESFPIARLEPKEEETIADLAEASAAARSRADLLERELAQQAERLIDRFIAGESLE